MTATRYVKTREAQEAVKGREIEIIQGLGISWQPGQKGHIRCPYPEHGGADDWRFDERRGSAICTCTGSKADSVFNIASKVEGLDFDDAKIRCVEIIGREDLIREKSGDGSFQATDAESLMRAPAERRDDALPRAYLAHRLGCEPADVLMPTTAAVGLRALAYFDPPKGKGKPPKVGEYPCAVFSQIDAQGRRHAHRIYLAPAGAGKADLGTRADGRERDPKKSARVIGEDSTAGRVVVWGNPGVAPWAISAEGIETAAAVARAFRPEIKAGEAYVIAGINAGGVEAFAPWPETKRVTVAADRDEATKINRPNPSRRGEKAARTFGLRVRQGVSVSIALAGEPGTSTDWLDVHSAHGVESVRAGILAAVSFTATDEEREEEQRRLDGLGEMARIARDYPLPTVDSLSLSYERTKTGKIWVHQAVKSGDSIEAIPVTSPFGVRARLRFADDGDAYGMRLVVQDFGGRCREIDVDRAAFARQGAADTRAMLFGAGLRSQNDGEHVAVKCLKAAEPEQEITVVRRPGWHGLASGGAPFFVCPDGQIIGAEGDDAPELSVNARISPPIARGGSLDGWRKAVAAACSAPRCEHWVIGTIAGFAAPILSLCGFDTCGVNLSGMTSGGKTTAQRLAVSAWSRAALDQRESLLQSARSTANGIELMAARSNGTVLSLDELGHVHGKELGKIIYSLASGVGKTRMGAEAQLRTSYTWATFVLFSAEKSLEEKVRGDGGEWAGGMAVRIPDIDISGINRAVDQGVLDQIGAVDRNFGHAGPAFVEALIKAGLHLRPEEIRQGIQKAAHAIAGPGADGKHVRAAIPFAILSTAGSMAKRLGILPAEVEVSPAIRWAWDRFIKSTDAVALDPEQQAVANLGAWIAERWGSTILPTAPDEHGRPHSRDAVGWYDDAAVYIPTGRIVDAAGGALKELEIGRALDAQDMIVKKHDASCFYVSYVPKVGKVKAYALKRAQFGRATDPARFELHQGGRA